MTESQYTSDLLSWFRGKGWLAFKIADGFTTGVPDAALIEPVFGDRPTTWLEMKLLKREQTFLERVKENKVQHAIMVALEPRSLYVIWSRGKMFIFEPKAFNGPNPQAIIAGATKEQLHELIRRK